MGKQMILAILMRTAAFRAKTEHQLRVCNVGAAAIRAIPCGVFADRAERKEQHSKNERCDLYWLFHNGNLFSEWYDLSVTEMTAARKAYG